MSGPSNHGDTEAFASYTYSLIENFPIIKRPINNSFHIDIYGIRFNISTILT